MHDDRGANRRPAQPRQPQGDTDAQFNEGRRGDAPAEQVDYGGWQMPVGGRSDEPGGHAVKKVGLALLNAAPDVSDGNRPAAGGDGRGRRQQRETQHDPIHVEPGLAAVLVLAKGKQASEQEAGDCRAVEPTGSARARSMVPNKQASHGAGRIGKPGAIGSSGKVRELRHTGAEASRPTRQALSRIARTQTVRRSTPANGSVNGMWQPNQSAVRGQRG